jgi:iron complex transport system substrate-binding protein
VPPSSRRAFVGGLATFLAGCGARSSAPPAKARVVSLSPSTTEAVFAIGAGDRLVGRSRFCDHPPEALGLPSVGGFSDPNIEAILALAPTLVAGARGPAGPTLESTLQAHGVATYFPETESFDQIAAMLAGLGERLGRADEGSAAAARLQLARRRVADAAKALPPPRAVLLFDVAPIVVAGPGGFPDEMMRLARAENLITEGGAYPTIGLERLVALDPDVILDGATAGTPGPSPLAGKGDAPGWRALRAFAAGRVHTLSSTVLRPGPRIGDGLQELARAVHGAAIRLE